MLVRRLAQWYQSRDQVLANDSHFFGRLLWRLVDAERGAMMILRALGVLCVLVLTTWFACHRIFRPIVIEMPAGYSGWVRVDLDATKCRTAPRHIRVISHTILACTPQGGGRNEWSGNSTSNTPKSHSREARRKAATKSPYRRTASTQSCFVEACALGRGVCLVLMGLPCGSCSVMCFVSPAVAFGAPASIPATSCATRRLRSWAVKAAQHGSGASSSVSISLGHASENRSTLTSSSTSIFQRAVQLRQWCTDA